VGKREKWEKSEESESSKKREQCEERASGERSVVIKIWALSPESESEEQSLKRVEMKPSSLIRVAVVAALFLGAMVSHRETLSGPAASPLATTVTVTAPNGGEVLYPTTTFTITWTATGVYGQFQYLYYSLDAGATWTEVLEPLLLHPQL
jgi:hypothetical protein